MERRPSGARGGQCAGAGWAARACAGRWVKRRRRRRRSPDEDRGGALGLVGSGCPDRSRRTRGRGVGLAGRADASRTAELEWSDSAAFHDSELATAVAGLSPQQRAVVALHYLDDLAVADVASTLRLSEGAVKYHLHQARARLRTALADLPDPIEAP